MPCCGPNLDYYRLHAAVAFDEIMALLNNKYDIMPLDKMNVDNLFMKMFLPRYSQEKENLRKALEELFVNEGCASF